MDYFDKGSISFQVYGVPDFKISKVDNKPVRRASIRYSVKGKTGKIIGGVPVAKSSSCCTMF